MELARIKRLKRTWMSFFEFSFREWLRSDRVVVIAYMNDFVCVYFWFMWQFRKEDRRKHTESHIATLKHSSALSFIVNYWFKGDSSSPHPLFSSFSNQASDSTMSMWLAMRIIRSYSFTLFSQCLVLAVSSHVSLSARHLASLCPFKPQSNVPMIIIVPITSIFIHPFVWTYVSSAICFGVSRGRFLGMFRLASSQT